MGNKEKTDTSTRGAAPLITYDGFPVEVQRRLEAAQCAVDIQRALSKRNDDMPIERRVEIRPLAPASCSMREAFKTFRFCLSSPAPNVGKSVREKRNELIDFKLLPTSPAF